jgi:hypothetical protein
MPSSEELQNYSATLHQHHPHALRANELTLPCALGRSPQSVSGLRITAGGGAGGRLGWSALPARGLAWCAHP